MPVYNGGEHLRPALDSVFAQSFGDFELVAVDDGSTDDTASLLREAAARDDRLRVISLTVNTGIVRALNRGLAACQGRFLARMDADDLAHPQRFRRQVDFLEANPDVAVVGTALRYIDRDGRSLCRIRSCRVAGSPLWANPLLHPTVMIRRSLVPGHRLRYREAFRYAEDYFLWLEIARWGRLAALDEVLLDYRLSPQATRMARVKEVLGATLKVKREAVRRLGYRWETADLLRFGLEMALQALPAAAIRWAYLLSEFGWQGRTAA